MGQSPSNQIAPEVESNVLSSSFRSFDPVETPQYSYNVDKMRTWKIMPTPDEAKEYFIKEGTIHKDSDVAQVEFRLLLNDPVSQEYMNHIIVEYGLGSILAFWINLLEFRSINTDKNRGLKASLIYGKYISSDSVSINCLPANFLEKAPEFYRNIIDIKLMLEAVSNGKININIPTDLFDEFLLPAFDKLYHEFFVPFKGSVRYEDLLKKLSLSYNHVDVSDFIFFEKLGQGTYGTVVHCRKKSTGVDFAVKIQTKSNLLKTFKDNVRKIELEKRASASCNHPFIVGLSYAFQTPSLVFMALDLGSSENLTVLLQREGKLSEARTKFYVSEIVSALGHIHDLGMIYRDLKPGNILLGLDGHIKLIDLGAVADLEGSCTNFDILGKNPITPLFNRQFSASNRSDLHLTTAAREHDIPVIPIPNYGVASNNLLKDGGGGDSSNMFSDCPSFHSMVQSDCETTQRNHITYGNNSARLPHIKRTRSVIGTFGYMAPEMVIILAQLSSEIFGYSYSVDWWALGVCAYKFLHGGRPFPEHSMTRLIQQAPEHNGTYEFSRKYAVLFQELEFDESLSPETKDFIKKLLDVNPVTRLGGDTKGNRGVSEVCSHPYFSGVDWDTILSKKVSPEYIPSNSRRVMGDNEGVSFETMVSSMGKNEWLYSLPSAEFNKVWTKWDYVSNRSLEQECNLTNSTFLSWQNFTGNISSSKYAAGYSASDVLVDKLSLTKIGALPPLVGQASQSSMTGNTAAGSLTYSVSNTSGHSVTTSSTKSGKNGFIGFFSGLLNRPNK